MVLPESVYDKSLMFQKSTINLLGWIVECFGSDSRDPLHPPLVPIRADFCLYQINIPDVSSEAGPDGAACQWNTCGSVHQQDSLGTAGRSWND